MEAEKQDDVDDLAVDRREVGLLGNQLVLRVRGGEGALEVSPLSVIAHMKLHPD